jgi:hypothetical protein
MTGLVIGLDSRVVFTVLEMREAQMGAFADGGRLRLCLVPARR